MIRFVAIFLSFICWSNALKLQLEPLERLENLYKELIAERLSSGFFNVKVTPNVILFLVEGLDSHTMSAARKILSDRTTSNSMHVLDSFLTGFIKPHSRDQMVADPAAASSSIFSGLPERNGQMGWVQQGNNTCLQRDESKQLANLFKIMSKYGKYTALVATAPLTSPGVAGTYASTPDMKLESDIHVNESGCSGFKDIASQLILDNNDLNVIVGSGRNYFHLKTAQDELTIGSLPDSRSDVDLKGSWENDKFDKQRPYKISIGKVNVRAALADGIPDYILGFMEEKDEIELTSQNLIDLVNNFRKKSSKSNGYFITVYIDQIARAHDASQGVKAAMHLDKILGFVNDIYGLVKGEDTLLLLASTQGSTLTVGSGSYLNERLVGFANTETCEPYTFLNYAFGVKKSPTFDSETEGLEYKFPSLYSTQGTTGGPDLPLFASGNSAGIFTGVNTFPYLHHAILCATCLATDTTHYPHCMPKAPTTTEGPATSTAPCSPMANPASTTPSPALTTSCPTTICPTTPCPATPCPATSSPASTTPSPALTTPSPALTTPSPALTTPSPPAATTTTTRFTAPPVTPPKPPVTPPKPNFWSWYFQPLAGIGPNPYANMVLRNGVASPAAGSSRPVQVPPTPRPTPRPAQNQNNQWTWQSWLPFMF